jgi:putative tryptophan/tyrosine transport system substrate-binding protein
MFSLQPPRHIPTLPWSCERVFTQPGSKTAVAAPVSASAGCGHGRAHAASERLYGKTRLKFANESAAKSGICEPVRLNDRLPALANELVRAQVSVILSGGPPAALAAKAASTTIPIVFTSGEDPVKMRIVASYSRPGGNATGIAALIDVLGAKRFGLLRELVPAATLITVLLNPTEPSFDSQLNDVQEAARAVGQQIHVMRASTEREIDDAFATAAQLRAGAMLVGVNFFYTLRRDQIVAQAARFAIPTIYGQRDFMSVGGLISYATNLANAYRQAGIYTGRILKGAKPADLPVMQSTKFELIINLKVAKTLGITIPPGVLAIADEVID